MTHAEWSEAAYNCFHFHSGHDVHGPDGSFASWWEAFLHLQSTEGQGQIL